MTVEKQTPISKPTPSNSPPPAAGNNAGKSSSTFGKFKYFFYEMFMDGDCATMGAVNTAYPGESRQKTIFVAVYTLSALWATIVGVNTPGISSTSFILLALLNANLYKVIFGEKTNVIDMFTKNILVFLGIFIAVAIISSFVLNRIKILVNFSMGVYVVYKIYGISWVRSSLLQFCSNTILLCFLGLFMALLVSFLINRYIVSAVGMLFYAIFGSVPSIIGTSCFISIITGGKSGVPLNEIKQFMCDKSYIYVPGAIFASLICQYIIGKIINMKARASEDASKKEEVPIKEKKDTGYSAVKVEGDVEINV